jgi:electron transport complex protein RnfC
VNRADTIGLVDCFECGACSYVCPARIPLTQRFKLGKDLLRNQRAKEARHGK